MKRQELLEKKLNNSFQTKIITAIVVFVLVLYGVIVFIPVFLKINSTPISTAYRFFYFVFSLISINYYFVFKRTPINKNLGTVCFILFWILYSYRVISDLTGGAFPVFYEGLSESYFYAYVFPGTLVPCVALILGGNSYLNYDSIIKFLFLGYVTTCVLALAYLGITYGFGPHLFSQRVSIESGTGQRSINPIQISLNGGFLMVFSLLNILFGNKEKFEYKLSYVTFFLGFICLLVGASRGPLIATSIVITIVFTYYLKTSKLNAKDLKRILLAVAVLVSSIVFLVNKVGAGNFNIVGRYDQMNQFDHTEEREEYAQVGLADFLESPLLGKNFLIMFEGEAGFVHNIFIESLHATGIIGSLFFYTMFFVAFYKCYRIFLQKTKLIYIMCFFLLTTIFGVSSGSLYANPVLWVSIVMILLTNDSFIKQNPV